jgi:hypothetical protein
MTAPPTSSPSNPSGINGVARSTSVMMVLSRTKSHRSGRPYRSIRSRHSSRLYWAGAMVGEASSSSASPEARSPGRCHLTVVGSLRPQTSRRRAARGRALAVLREPRSCGPLWSGPSCAKQRLLYSGCAMSSLWRRSLQPRPTRRGFFIVGGALPPGLLFAILNRSLTHKL